MSNSLPISPLTGYKLLAAEHLAAPAAALISSNEGLALVSSLDSHELASEGAVGLVGAVGRVSNAGPDGSVNNWNASVKVVDQGPFGSCTSFATRYVHLLKLANQSRPTVEPSCAYWYSQSRVKLGLSPTRDTGSTLSSTVWVLQNKPSYAEPQWPYTAYNILRASAPTGTASIQYRSSDIVTYGSLPTTRSSAAAVSAFLTWVRARLSAGQCVAVSLPIYANFETYAVMSTGVVPMPSGSFLGGHAVALVGFAPSSSTFTFVNSWGTYTGLSGMFTIPYAYIGNYTAEAFAI